MVVKDLVAHILLHVNAEVVERDFSQTAGYDNRAQHVRDMVEGFKNDARDLPLGTIITELANTPSLSALDPAFKRTVASMKGEARPQLVLQEWVGKMREQRGG